MGRKAVSNEQKERIIVLGLGRANVPLQPSDLADIAEIVDVHPKTVSRVLKLFQQTGWTRRPRCEMKKLGRPRKLDVDYGEWYIQSMRKRGLKLVEVQKRLLEIDGTNVSLPVISRATNERWAEDRDKKCNDLFESELRRFYRPEQLVFASYDYASGSWLDKVLPNVQSTQHLHMDKPDTIWVGAALTMNGLLHCDSWNRMELFDITSYFEKLLDSMNPFPMSNSVLVLHDWTFKDITDKRPLIEEMIASRGIRLVPSTSEILWANDTFYEYLEEVWEKAEAMKDELSAEVLERIGSCDKAEDAFCEFFKLAASKLEPGLARKVFEKTIYRKD